MSRPTKGSADYTKAAGVIAASSTSAAKPQGQSLKPNATIQLRELRVRSLTDKDSYLSVIHPLNTQRARRKVAALLRRPPEEIRLICQGELFGDHGSIPEACYDKHDSCCVRWVDPETLRDFLASQRASTGDPAAPCEVVDVVFSARASTFDSRADGSQASISYIETEDDSLPKTGSQTLICPGENTGRGDVIRSDNRPPEVEILKANVAGPTSTQDELVDGEISPFNLRCELEDIQCKQYAPLLEAEGFASKATFACVDKQTLQGPPMYIPLSACKRIMNLAAEHRKSLEAAVKEKTVNSASTINKTRQQYTLDGKQFFDTVAEMKSYLAVQQKASAKQQVKQRTAGKAMAAKKQHSARVFDLMQSIGRQLQIQADREEGLAVYDCQTKTFCCAKHKKLLAAEHAE